MSAARRYLERYGAPEHREIPEPSGAYPAVLVVPCCAEPPDALARTSAQLSTPTAIICVVNEPQGASARWSATNRKFLEAMGPANQWLRLPGRTHEHGLLLVDRATRPLQRREGVGGARRIGADIAVAGILNGWIESRWVHQTDADARLPAGYCEATAPLSGTALYPFKHTSPDPGLARKAWLYEQHMRLYREGLQRARSPYAHTALGSSMAMHIDTYVAVRGMPRRDGAEDFHYVNKAAKVADVHSLKAPVVELSARLSDRVPFGTGPAIAAIPENEALYLTFNPASFDSLAELLAWFGNGEGDPPATAAAIARPLGLAQAVANLRRQHQGRALTHALHIWFDGLKTLRFLRLARTVFPDVSLVDQVHD